MALKKNLGQYFTTNVQLKQKMFELILNEPTLILEPSMGQGDLVEFISQKMSCVDFDLYEIDDEIKILDTIDKTNIKYCDFIQEPITKKYQTIIGNFHKKMFRFTRRGWRTPFYCTIRFYKINKRLKIIT